ncbi:hypothetical protein [Streptomyces vinaceus]|uniref:hypothetical protein n=1 Tax=Streptomyces vinaceus TaxID=1960 RepID=UPI00382E4F28
MANRAVFVLCGPGGHTRHRSSYGAVGLDLDLLAGPDTVLPFLAGHVREDDWYPDDMVEAGVLADREHRLLLVFAWEGPIASPRTRAATLELLRRAWPGWEVRWLYDGQSGLRAHLGLPAQEAESAVYPCPVLDVDDEELDEPDPLVAVVTVGGDRCHVLAAVEDHPVEEGPALLDRLRGAPDHGSHRLYADGGVHVDPRRRRVGWWLTAARAHARDVAARRPGWTVEFWEDRWTEHVRAAGGRFAPPVPDRAAALADVRGEALERWSGPRADARARLVAAHPRMVAPAVSARRAADARAVIEAAHGAAVRP